MKKFFHPVGWLIVVTLFMGMATTFTLFWPVESMESAGLSTTDADVANFVWLSLIFSAGYLFAAAGIGALTRGAVRAKLVIGYGASLLFWVILGAYVIVGPVIGLMNFAPDGGAIPLVTSLGLMISGYLHLNDSEKEQV
jgi:hypothetical protein